MDTSTQILIGLAVVVVMVLLAIYAPPYSKPFDIRDNMPPAPPAPPMPKINPQRQVKQISSTRNHNGREVLFALCHDNSMWVITRQPEITLNSESWIQLPDLPQRKMTEIPTPPPDTQSSNRT